MRLVLSALAVWGVTIAMLPGPWVLAAAVGVAAALGAVLCRLLTRSRTDRTGQWGRAGIAVLGCTAAAAAVVAIKIHTVTTGPIAELAEQRMTVTAEVVVTNDPRVRSRPGGTTRRASVVIEGRVVRFYLGEEPPAGTAPGAGRESVGEVDVPVVLFGSGDQWAGLLPSQRIRVRGRLGVADPGELVAAVMLVRGPPQVLSAPSVSQTAAGALREGLRKASEVLPPEERGLLPGLVVGDESRLDEEVRADLTKAGLSHLTAVSGANLAFIAAAALVLARFAGLPLPARAAVAVVAMVGFVIVARPSPSVLRALVMGVVAAIALGTGRSRDGMAALAASVLGLILFDPALARQYGFALSVFATGGILELAPRWRERLARRMPRWAAEAIAVPAAAQVAVTPILVFMAGQLEPVAVPANLLAEPAVAPATVLGFAAALIAPISMDLACLIVRPAGLAAGWIITVAHGAAGLPGAAMTWPGGWAGLALVLIAGAAVWLVLRRSARRRMAIAVAAGGAVALLVVGPVATAWPPEGWLLVACDVGQGDGLALSAGPGRAVVIDTGPEPGRIDRCLRDLGVRDISLLVLTHFHVDHVGGLIGALRDRRVGAAVVSPIRVPRREGDRVSAELRARRVPEWVVTEGTHWRFGPVELTVLAPGPQAAREGRGEGSVANNASVVVLARWAAGSALLAGDLETESEDAMLRGGIPPVDILKVPHHGSSRQDPAFLAATRARVALISVGADNDYGHPSPVTLGRLSWLGMRTYRTDLSGDVAVIVQDGRLAIAARSTP